MKKRTNITESRWYAATSVRLAAASVLTISGSGLSSEQSGTVLIVRGTASLINQFEGLVKDITFRQRMVRKLTY